MNIRKARRIFLALSLLPLLIMLLLLHIQRYRMHCEMQDHSYRNRLVCLSIDSAQYLNLEWEGDEEFVFEGTMYDVVYTKQSAGKYLFWCIKDDVETMIIDQLRAFLMSPKSDTPENETGTSLGDFFKHLYCHEVRLPAHFSLVRDCDFSECKVHMCLRTELPQVPPPKVG